MAVIEAAFKGWGGGVLLGVGAALAAPVILPVAGAVLRPIAKTTIWGFLVVADKLKEVTAETREQMNDLVAEVRAEYTDGSPGTSSPRRTRPTAGA